MLVDSHCHLDFPDFAEDLDATVARAGSAGVGFMVTICTYLSRFEQVRAVAARFPTVACSAGVHPHNAAEEEGGLSTERLVTLAEDPKVVGIGECGLDYYYDKSPRDVQAESFRLQIRAALATGLPVIIHTREAEEDTMTILKEEAPNGGLTGVLHCFSGTRALAEAGVDFGLHVSFSGILTFKKAEDLRATAACLPVERVLVETDAPYLAPPPHRGKRNEPSYVVKTARVLAETMGVSEIEIARRTTENFFALFPKARVLAGQDASCA